MKQIFIPALCTILVYQYCDRQVQEIPNVLWGEIVAHYYYLIIKQTAFRLLSTVVLSDGSTTFFKSTP